MKRTWRQNQARFLYAGFIFFRATQCRRVSCYRHSEERLMPFLLTAERYSSSLHFPTKARSKRDLNSVRRPTIFVGPHYGTCFISSHPSHSPTSYHPPTSPPPPPTSFTPTSPSPPTSYPPPTSPPTISNTSSYTSPTSPLPISPPPPSTSCPPTSATSPPPP